jgi:2',3'-cyclic-nucleotide 2'-phosphodiesterase (5'-nucleotidase family)
MRQPVLNRREFLRVSALCGAGTILAACTPELADYSTHQTDTLRSLTILYTNDEHGWMEASDLNGGAASMLQSWQREAGYTRDGTFLVLSGGDMWTGPALSTWFKGESMVDVMNTMGYTAAAIGNHDFDFGVANLRQRAAQAKFPFLSANIREKATGRVPDFVRPYVIQKVNGIRIGLIGLTTLETPMDTNPSNVEDFKFIPYSDALQDVSQRAKANGAQLLVLLGHLCIGEMRSLATITDELDIQILCTGHCHEETVEQAGDGTIVQSGSFLQKYIRIGVLFDTISNRLVDMGAQLLDNPAHPGDPEIASLVQEWHNRADPALWQVFGYAGKKIDSLSDEMTYLLTTPWMEAHPSARIALFSPRYVQSLPAGDLSEASMMSMIPMDNELVDMQLTGAQILETIQSRHPSVGGLRASEEGYILADGSPLEPDASYHVLVPDSLYEGGNHFEVRQYDPEAIYTGTDWRTPVVNWVKSLNTSHQNPIETYLHSIPENVQGRRNNPVV